MIALEQTRKVRALRQVMRAGLRPARQASSRVRAAIVATVPARRPQKLSAPCPASSMRPVISLTVASIRLRHSAMTYSSIGGMWVPKRGIGR